MIAPYFALESHALADRTIAAAAWQRLLTQEDQSRAFTARLASDLERLGAPVTLLAAAQRIAGDEARHVELCSNVVHALGFASSLPAIIARTLPDDDEAFEQAMAEILVAGFAVGETMSVGGFVAVRAVAGEPLMRWTLGELARDEVTHGAFGEAAGAWLLRGWSDERRRALWPACVSVMESVERRAGGPVGDHRHQHDERALARLGAPARRVAGAGILSSVPRWVLPRLARLGVLPIAA